MSVLFMLLGIPAGVACLEWGIYEIAFYNIIKERGYTMVKGQRWQNFFDFLKCNIPILAFCCIPVINLTFIVMVIKDFREMIESDLENFIETGKIEKVYLPKVQEKDDIKNIKHRIKAVRKLEAKHATNIAVRSLCDFTTDEKIMFYLNELEHLYQEKAKEEGFDLEEDFEELEVLKETPKSLSLRLYEDSLK